MAIRKIDVERFSLVSSEPFEGVVAKLDAAVGHPDMSAFRRDMTAAQSLADVETVVRKAVGTSGFMEFTRFDVGEVLRKEPGARTPKSLRFVIGNPLVMKQMADHVPDVASYAPVTILIDERPDGVHLSYDKMASFLAAYGSTDALKVARDLDSEIEQLLSTAAA